MRAPEPRLIEGCLYDDATYGPTILVRLLSIEAVEWLRRTFLDVAEGSTILNVVGQPGVELKGVERFELVLAPTTRRHRYRFGKKHLSRIGRRPSFVWAATPDEWRDMAAMLDPFLGAEPGFQFLTHEDSDDALVEVAFGEAHPRVG